MITFQQFVDKVTNPPGQRIDYDGVFKFQCVDLPLQYIHDCKGINGAYGNAIDWWNRPDPKVLTGFDKLQTTSVNAGDIMILKTLGYYGDPIRDPGYGHIMLATGAQNDQLAEGLEQNGSTGNGSGTGGDAIRTRYIEKNRLAGVLRPKPAAPTIPMISQDQLTQVFRDLLHRDPDIGAIQHYVSHYTYDFVLNDVQNSNEYKIVHAPPPPAPVPQTVPAAPVPIPTSLEKYYVVKSIPAYGSWIDANARQNPAGHVNTDWYFIFNRLNGMFSLTKIPGQSSATWINPADNVVDAPTPPVPTVLAAETVVPVAKQPDPANDWKTTKTLFPKPIFYKALEDMTIIDIAGIDLGTGITVKSDESIPMLGTFIRSNITYLYCRPSDRPKDCLYGVPTDDYKTGAPTMISDVASQIAKQRAMDYRDYRRSVGHSTPSDQLFYFKKAIADFVNKGGRFVDGIIAADKLRVLTKAKQKK